MNQYTRIILSEVEADVSSFDDLPLAISSAFEDTENFQQKKGSDSFSIEIPATLINSRIANTSFNPSVADLTAGTIFKSAGKAIIERNSVELLVGKSFLRKATHTGLPGSYTFDFVADNKDWGVSLKETNLYDLLQHIQFAFTKAAIVDSWVFDGTSEALPYVFAPVRYRDPMGEQDDNMLPDYMRPSISKYWLIYWAFRSIGYKVSSSFFNTSYFRRQVMPWTWGNFLYSDGTRLDNLDFQAKSTEYFGLWNLDYNDFWDLDVSNDSTNGAFDNNDTYQYLALNKEMRWTYLNTFNYGNLDATLKFQIRVDATVAGGGVFGLEDRVVLKLYWYKNGVLQGTPSTICDIRKTSTGRKDFNDIVDFTETFNVSPGDYISAKVHLDMNETSLGRANVQAEVTDFSFTEFRIPFGGMIDFRNYTAFKKVKFLDFLRGVTDEFNLAYKTDNISKIVYVEPLHAYSLAHDLSIKNGGFIVDNYVDWTEKQDLSQVSELELFADGERELLFKYKNDDNDGCYKIISNRYNVTPAAGKYLLPDRYQAGKKEVENRFFSPSFHYEVNQWKSITGTPPQMMALIPENISNTSEGESEATLLPKSAYYKGFDFTSGWKFDGELLAYFPFMFAVNYKPGGYNDPILSYSDERIGNQTSGYTVGRGLLKRFFWQRLAIMRVGWLYRSRFDLRSSDILSLHNDYKVVNGVRFERPAIKSFKPLKNETTEVELWKWEPVSEEDAAKTFPSSEMITGGSTTASEDVKYAPLIVLTSDIP